MDGLTTNGVLLMNPTGGPSCQPTIWREISVCGKVYGLRKTRSTTDRGKTVSSRKPDCDVNPALLPLNSILDKYCILG